uniref:Uncharacterized protein n=1 Tax=Anguilla anguilla TaxID=7936 RepID=A0A0E9QXQ8_ANGAN
MQDSNPQQLSSSWKRITGFTVLCTALKYHKTSALHKK